MKNFVSILSLCGAAALWGGCSSNDASANKAAPEPPAYVWFDDGMPRKVSCAAAKVWRTPDGRMKVMAKLRNDERYRVEVQTSCVFMDAQGFTTDEVPFRTLILDESAMQDVSFESFNTNSMRYLVRVRKAR